MVQKVIMQVIPSLQQGGVEVGTLEIAAALQKEKMPNIVVSAGGKMVPMLTKMGVKHIELPVQTKNPIKMWLNARRLASVMKENNVGLVHVRSRAPAWSVKWACAKTGIPFITTFHGAYGTKPECLKKRYNRVMTEGKCIIAVSQFIQNHIMKEYGVPDTKIRLIYRGADLNKFNPKLITDKKIADFAEKYKIDLTKPIITMAGRMSPIKGHGVLLDALVQMKHHDVNCLFIGGKAKPKYVEVLQKKMASVPAGVTIQNFSVAADEMPLVYALSDVVVSASLVPESFGRTIVEAQAMGKIVIASSHGGATETISNDRTGFLVPVGDAKALAGVLDMVLDMKPRERAVMEKKAQESVQTNFSIQKMCDKTIQLYKEILS